MGRSRMRLLREEKLATGNQRSGDFDKSRLTKRARVVPPYGETADAREWR
jgi:hypothetical protein